MDNDVTIKTNDNALVLSSFIGWPFFHLKIVCDIKLPEEDSESS